MTGRQREAFDQRIQHLAAAICYRLVAAAALAEGDPQQTVDLLTWEADRHECLARKRSRRIPHPHRQAA